VLHEGALEPVGFSTFLRAEQDELETAVDIENGSTILKAIDKPDTTPVEKPFP